MDLTEIRCVWTGFKWFRKGSNHKLLWAWQWTF